MRKSKWIVLLPTLLFVGCAGTPATHYYTLHVPPPEPAAEHPGPTLGIEPFAADPLYAGYKLVYRASPYRVEYYHYHQWAVEPTEQVTRAIASYLKHSGRFARVTILPDPTPVSFRLKGHILELGEWDSGDQWYGRLRIAFELVRSTDEAILWQNELSRSVPAESRNPESVVKALSRGVSEVAQEVQSSILATIGSNP